jgi:hypothetical protein
MGSAGAEYKTNMRSLAEIATTTEEVIWSPCSVALGAH